MSELQLKRFNTTSRDGTIVQLVYDQEVDILEIFFGANVPATGIELTDSIILRYDGKAHRAVSLTLLHFSVLTEHTQYGPRSYPVNKLDSLPIVLRDEVLRSLATLPVSQFIKLSYYQASPRKFTPLAFVESQPALAYA